MTSAQIAGRSHAARAPGAGRDGLTGASRSAAPEALAEAPRAKERSRADWKRSSGRFSRQCSTTCSRASGTALRTEVRDGASSRRIAVIVSARGRSIEGPAAREHLVEDGAQGKDIGPVIREIAPHLLRRHVADGPHHDSRLRGPGYGGRAGQANVVRANALPREAEVEDLDVPVASHEEVLRLQVAMHDPPGVRRGKALGNLPPVLDHLLRGKRTNGKQFPDRLPLQELHDRVVAPPACPKS